MKIAIMCDRCRAEFMGEEWMQDSTREILCPSCYADKETSEI